jgi:hypothetical protein
MPVTDDEVGREYLWWKYGTTLPVSWRAAWAVSRANRVLTRRLPTGLASRTGRRQPLQAILQHDADRQPYKTVEMLERERRLGVRSSAYFFYERHVWDDDYEPYLVDVPALQALERDGFEIGYHLNAYELAGYDDTAVDALVERDLRWFAERFNLRSFVPHGGVSGPGGRNNFNVPRRGTLQRLMWAYDRRGVLVDGRWSDGYAWTQPLPDPRVLARQAPDGARLHILMHPQYYGTELSPIWLDRPIATQRWWRDLWNLD